MSLGRFQIRSRIGVGATATVYRAFDPRLERDVALKVLHDGALEGSIAIARFEAEARSLARLRHARIVPIYEAGCEGGRHYIASEFIEGRGLATTLDGPPVDFRSAARIVADLARALTHAHDMGVVHRDVKPANVLIDTGGAAHLMDFGIAHRQGESQRLTVAGSILGTPAYLAPEQASGGADPLPSGDQYSLGVVLYELLCGKPPFSGSAVMVLYRAVHEEPARPRSLRPDAPRELEAICLKAIARSPDDRYASCRELAEDLQRWLGGKPIRVRPARPLDHAVRWCRREPVATAAIALVALGLIATTALAARLGVRDDRQARPSMTAKAVSIAENRAVSGD